ncbi:MAG: PKD domain-containing protein [Chloroflexi bacterium]|nr:PKD domain-containing protein [Chloroflexota bacterium]
MVSSPRQITVGLLCGTAVLFVLAWFGLRGSQANTAVLSTMYPGRAQIGGSVQLNLSLDKAVAQVGDALTLNLSLLNQETAVAAPEIILTLPPSLKLDMAQIGRGTTFNLQNNTINWQPVANGNGGLAQTSLEIQVAYVDPAQPEQRILATLRHNNTEQQTELVLWAGTLPTGRPLVNPGRASVGQPVQLQAETSGSGPIGQLWSSGDGRLIPATNPMIVYPAVGTYNVGLQVSNPLGSHNSQEVVVIVPEPAAFFSISDSAPAVNQVIQFTSQGGGQPPLNYLWDFGDGSISAEANPRYQYSQPGTYIVQLVIRNAFGQAANYLTVSVGEVPIADLEVPETAEAGWPVTGQAYISENVTSIRWDMGDGQLYEGEQIQHSYDLPGQYIITMRAANDYGEVLLYRMVTVSGASGTRTYLPFIQSNGLLELGEEGGDPSGTQLAIDSSTIVFVDVTAPITLTENIELAELPAAEQLLWYINEARRQAGMGEVGLIPSLSTAAKQHTDDMAAEKFTGHTGSDGSPPYERLARVGFREGGYAGETTAWGFRHAYEAVQFWLDSPPHRAILLNPIANQVGVAQTTNYNAPNVWYWTAEFASSYGSITSQMHQAGIRLTAPTNGQEFFFGETVYLRWVWPLPLTDNQRFALYLTNEEGEGERQIAVVLTPTALEALIGTPQEGQVYLHSFLVNDLFTRAGDVCVASAVGRCNGGDD